jgi:small subunit ribosomal protein S4
MLSKPRYKVGRRLGAGVYEKCQTPKFVASSQRKGKSDKRPKQKSEFGMQLIEKQRVRYSYGITERQLSNYVEEAMVTKGSAITDTLYRKLETRLDNVVYRLGFVSSRRAARQLVSHGHITVNGRRVTIPSMQIRVNDVIGVREGSKKSPLFSNLAEQLKEYKTPAWLSWNSDMTEATVRAVPQNTEEFINLGSVIEFYSR